MVSRKFSLRLRPTLPRHLWPPAWLLIEHRYALNTWKPVGRCRKFQSSSHGGGGGAALPVSPKIWARDAKIHDVCIPEFFPHCCLFRIYILRLEGEGCCAGPQYRLCIGWQERSEWVEMIDVRHRHSLWMSSATMNAPSEINTPSKSCECRIRSTIVLFEKYKKEWNDK